MSDPHALPPGDGPVSPDPAPLPWLEPLAPPPAARRAAFHALVCDFNLR
ncbi:MAG: bcscK, partial [Burkholderia sp.]|nr:bcscK [Burkholderia sp.]